MISVAIIGCGLIGRAWANVFARAGWAVRLWDPNPDVLASAPDAIKRTLSDLAVHGLVRDPAAAAQRLSAHATLEDAVAGVDLVQENGPETLDAKVETFARLDKSAPPQAILASSTSAIVASRFTEGLAGRHRCVVAHPVNPPHLVPVVELCGAPWTSDDTRARARALYKSVGQSPIDVRSEIDGFVLNRLQGALLAEAFRLVGDGIVSPQDLDTTIAEGLGLRWSFLGPFATIELNAPGGMADYCARYTGFYKRLQAAPAPATVWDDANTARVVAAWGRNPTAAEVTARSADRDARLAALAAHKQARAKR
jgi:3-hydroxyacyl-CoA dehydrogenase